LSILALGDWGAQLNLVDEESVAKTMDKWAQEMGTTAVISLGDNYYKGGIYNYDGVQSADDPKFNTLWKDVFDGSTLSKLPWWVIMGNHDWMGIDSYKYELLFTKNPQWILPDYFYTKRVLIPGTTSKYASFIFLDTNLLQYGYKPGGEMEHNFKSAGWTQKSNSIEKQIQWLEMALFAANKDEFVFVLGHHGCFSCEIDVKESKDMHRVLDLINKYRVTAYMHGHHHTLAYYYTNNNSTLHIQSGAGGRTDGPCVPVDTAAAGQEKSGSYGFVHLRVYQKFSQFEFVTENGEIVFNAYMETRTPVEGVTKGEFSEVNPYDSAIHFNRINNTV
ncbi:Metallo-dependent phosphatase-like protein, partial [Obelidium mucronatum]